VSREDGQMVENEVALQDSPARPGAEARDRERLEESLREVRRLAAHLQDSREHERRLIAREIHDELGHQLTALKIDLVSLERELQRTNSILASRATSMKALFDQVIGSVRRISSELRPGLLDDFGLATAIEWQAEAFEERTGVATEFVADAGDDSVSAAVQIAVFRILQEALDNVARHARADRVRVALRREHGELRLEVSDDGVGFDLKRPQPETALGLTGMRERAIGLGGSFRIETHPGAGTNVALILPLAGARESFSAGAAPWLAAS